MQCRRGLDPFALLHDAVGERGAVADRGGEVGCLLHGGERLVRQPVHQGNEEVPGPHGRVADLQVEEGGGRVGGPEIV